MIAESPTERDVGIDTEEEAGINGVPGNVPGETTHTIHPSASEPQGYSGNGERRRSVIP